MIISANQQKSLASCTKPKLIMSPFAGLTRDARPTDGGKIIGGSEQSRYACSLKLTVRTFPNFHLQIILSTVCSIFIDMHIPEAIDETAMSAPLTIYTSTLFDPKKRAFVSNISITVDPASGLIVDVAERRPGELGSSVPAGDIDLRDKVVMPGFVDAHTHIFIHSYK